MWHPTAERFLHPKRNLPVQSSNSAAPCFVTSFVEDTSTKEALKSMEDLASPLQRTDSITWTVLFYECDCQFTYLKRLIGIWFTDSDFSLYAKMATIADGTIPWESGPVLWSRLLVLHYVISHETINNILSKSLVWIWLPDPGLLNPTNFGMVYLFCNQFWGRGTQGNRDISQFSCRCFTKKSTQLRCYRSSLFSKSDIGNETKIRNKVC